MQCDAQVPGPNLPARDSSVSLMGSLSSWRQFARQLVSSTTPSSPDTAVQRIPAEPSRWSDVDVAIWLKWAAKEFQLFSESVAQFTQNFKLDGRTMVGLRKEEFCSRAPPYIGEILWQVGRHSCCP